MNAITETVDNALDFGFQRAEKETHSIVEAGGVKYYRIETWNGKSMQVPLEELVQAFALVQLKDSLVLNIAITFLDTKALQEFGWSSELVQVLNVFRWYVFYKHMGHPTKPAAQIVEEMAKNMPKSQIKIYT